MSKYDGTQVLAMQRPSDDDKEAWKNYWKTQGWPWRTEPEIDIERRSIKPDWKQGIFPLSLFRSYVPRSAQLALLPAWFLHTFTQVSGWHREKLTDAH